MNRVDHRGDGISGATQGALDAYERAIAAFQGWRRGADAHLDQALQEAPGFVMAHALKAWLILCSRDPRSIRSARPVLARAVGLPANERERLHLAAISAAIDDDFQGTRERLDDVLRSYPRDALALQVAHSLDYLTGDADRMRRRVAGVLPAWSNQLPGYHAILAMHAFSLEECGEYDRAEQVAREALALNTFDARAHHVMAHVFEMTGRPDAGVRWLNANSAFWDGETTVATHCWWHLALFHLAQGRPDDALAVYDTRVRAERSGEVADLIDASALLWRIRLGGSDAGARWDELAAAWDPHIDDAFCSFSDLHAMLAFTGAHDQDRAHRLERVLARAQARPTRHGETTRVAGLPACRALSAFGREDDALAITLLASLPDSAHRLGGSQAQRDVLHLTLQHAIERMRRRTRRVPVASVHSSRQRARAPLTLAGGA